MDGIRRVKKTILPVRHIMPTNRQSKTNPVVSLYSPLHLTTKEKLQYMESDTNASWKWKRVTNNFKRKKEKKFSLTSIFQGNRRKAKEETVLEVGGGVGIGCGVGVGFGLVGGVGYGGWPWNHLHLVFGVGVGCGVGLGLGMGQGIGYGFSLDSLDSYSSEEKTTRRDRIAIPI